MPDGAPRIPGFDDEGLHRYSLTICVARRRSVFISAAMVSPVLAEVAKAALHFRFKLLARSIGEYPFAGCNPEWIEPETNASQLRDPET
jgi:hypothetical protein